MSSNCKICSCYGFIPNRWKKTLCSNCYHGFSNHNIKLDEPLFDEVKRDEVKILEKPKRTYVTYVYDLFSIFTLYFYMMFYKTKND